MRLGKGKRSHAIMESLCVPWFSSRGSRPVCVRSFSAGSKCAMKTPCYPPIHAEPADALLIATVHYDKKVLSKHVYFSLVYATTTSHVAMGP